MKLTVFESDLLIDALTARAARYTSMACDDTLSMRALSRYELRAGAMRILRDKLQTMKNENKPMALEVA